MVHKSIALFSVLFFAAGCMLPKHAGVKKIERNDTRSLEWRYRKMMASPAGRMLHDKAAHSPSHAHAQAVTLAKQVKEVETDVTLYKAVGLSSRAKRRYKAMLDHTKRRVADGALNAHLHTRT